MRTLETMMTLFMPLLVWLPGCGSATPPSTGVYIQYQHGEGQLQDFRAAFAVYATTSGMEPNEKSVIVIVSAEGDMVFSRNELDGGPPYYHASVSRDAVSDVSTKLQSLFVNKRSGTIFSGPDARMTIIGWRDEGRWAAVASWHELAEKNPNLVVTERGVEPLNGRRRSDVLAKESAEYQKFRADWSAARDAITPLVPLVDVGEPIHVRQMNAVAAQ